jgi:hypothetical protein
MRHGLFVVIYYAPLIAIPPRICGIPILIRVEMEQQYRALGIAAALAADETQTKTDRALTDCFLCPQTYQLLRCLFTFHYIWKLLEMPLSLCTQCDLISNYRN